MRSAGVRCNKRRQQRCASMQAKLRVSTSRHSQLIGSTLAAHAVRDLPLPKTGEGAILGPTTTPNPGNVGSRRVRASANGIRFATRAVRTKPWVTRHSVDGRDEPVDLPLRFDPAGCSADYSTGPTTPRGDTCLTKRREGPSSYERDARGLLLLLLPASRAG
jgi:hypothetical protein